MGEGQLYFARRQMSLRAADSSSSSNCYCGGRPGLHHSLSRNRNVSASPARSGAGSKGREILGIENFLGWPGDNFQEPWPISKIGRATPAANK